MKEIININAQKLVEDMYSGDVETQYDEEYNDVFYVIDLDLDTKSLSTSPYVSQISSIQDNPIFHQLDQMNSNSKIKASNMSIIDKLIYFDFGRAFDYIPKSNFENTMDNTGHTVAKKTEANDTILYESAEALAASEKAYNEENMPEELYGTIDEDGNYIPGSRPQYFAEQFIDIASSPREILKELFNNGLQIRFHKGKKESLKHFVPFDKSSSMGRRNTISFIDDSLIHELNKRLLLDIDISKTELNLAKFYAYKGLYFTSSSRIKSPDIILNQKTVIVLPDINYHSANNETIDTITAIPPQEGNEKSEQSYTICNKKMPKSDVLKNLFDGEGIICPEYANLLNRELHLSENTSSYQIRMPFTKGVLHKVDFHKFIKNYGKLTNGKYMIRDVFGKERNLMEAKIILTQSMFKCIEWFEKAFKNNSDPMQYFFKKFTDYDHALYIANTDNAYYKKNLIQLNYQFLNTLCLSINEYDALLETHRRCIKKPFDYLKNHAYIRVDDENPDEEQETPASENWFKILSDEADNEEIFKKLTSEDFIKSKQKSVSASIKNKLASGKYLISGEIRFLSRDLLFLLYNLLNENDQSANNNICNEFLNEAEFDMPQSSCELMPGYHYAIFRSPHLSRNEQCALQYAKIETNSIRHKYLSHLSGVLMLSHLSVDPLTLGGADFDGDLVKVFNNDIIRDSVLRNRYNLGKKEYKPNTTYTRHTGLPVIDIQPYRVELKGIYKTNLDFDIIANTFSNSIGQLSNLSSKYGKLVYSPAARKYVQKNNKDLWEKMIKKLIISMDKNLFNLNLKEQTEVSFGSKKYTLDALKEMRASTSQELEYADFPDAYRNALEEICLENFCPGLTIYTGMDIDAPKNNIRPNIDYLFSAFASLYNTYNYLDNFKYKIDNMYNQAVYMPKVVINQTQYQLGNDSFHIQYPLSPNKKLFSIDLIPYFFFKETLPKKRQTKSSNKEKTPKTTITKTVDIDSKNEPQKRTKKYKKTSEAIEAYAQIRKDCIKKFNQIRHYNQLKYLENAKLICNTQYPDSNKYKDIEKLYSEFLKFGFSYETLYKMHKELAFSEWEYLPKEQRPLALKSLLNKYIKDNSDNDLSAFMENDNVSLLYNFNNKGYFLLYLLIGQALRVALLKTPEALFEDSENEVYTKLKETVSDAITKANKEAKIISFSSDVESELINAWKEIIKGKEYDTKLIRTITKDNGSSIYNRIFWDTFSESELKDILKKEVKENAKRKG